jgi:hypothetical protein
MRERDELFETLAEKYIARYFSGMPKVPVYISAEGDYVEPNTLAFYRPSEKVIVVNREWASPFMTKKEIENTVKHELIHAWLHWMEIDQMGEFLDKEEQHSEWFVKKALEIGVDVEYLLTSPKAVHIYNRVTNRWIPPHLRDQSTDYPDPKNNQDDDQTVLQWPQNPKPVTPISESGKVISISGNSETRDKEYSSDFSFIHSLAWELADYFKGELSDEEVPSSVIDKFQIIADDLLPLYDNMPGVTVDVQFWRAAHRKYGHLSWNTAFSFSDKRIVLFIADMMKKKPANRITELIKSMLVYQWMAWAGKPKNIKGDDSSWREQFYLLKALEVGAEDARTARVWTDNSYLTKNYNYWRTLSKNELKKYLDVQKIKSGENLYLPPPPSLISKS